MSGNSYHGYAPTRETSRSLVSDDWRVRERAADELREQNRLNRERIEREADARLQAAEAIREMEREARESKTAAERERALKKADAEREKVRKEEEARANERKRDTTEVYDRGAVRSTITRPPAEADRLVILLIDNSSSNFEVAKNFWATSGYLLATLGAFSPKTALAVSYFSDHCDNSRIRQDVDYVLPGEEGDRILHSTTRHVEGAGGGDDAEAHECILRDICDLKFDHIPKERRHVILVSDVAGHGMGHRGDDGCPRNVDWKDSVARVHKTFATFQVVFSGMEPSFRSHSQKFISAERLAFDHVDLSSIKSTKHRLGIIGNAVLFLIARSIDRQMAIVFLQLLYAKWLAEPIFGQETDMNARVAIQRFIKYLGIPEGSDEERELLDRIFAE